MNSKLRILTVTKTVFVLAIFLSPNAIAWARPLDQYVSDIDKSRTELRPFAVGNLDLGNEVIERAASDIIAGISKRIPEHDEIEFKDEAIPVDNGWIKQAALVFESEREPAKKLLALQSVIDRLDAIYFHASRVPALERRKTGKDEEKRRLSEILKREEYSVAGAGEDSPASRFYKYLMEWLRSLFPESQPMEDQGAADLRFLQNGLQIFIYLLALALVAYLIVRFGPQVIRKYRKAGDVGRKQIILGEEIAADATPGDLFSEAERLALQGDIRGAIRKGYISLLFELGQRRLIGLAMHKTNRDYLSDIEKNKRLRSRVAGLTRDYENVWYGNRNAGNEDWSDFRASYRDTLG